MIDRSHALPIARQAKALNVSRGSVYYLPRPVSATWTGQRQGDLLRLPWPAYNGSVIRLKQGKTGARVTVPVGAPPRR